jgi:murein DD-endopeptidase MepM/ murein hydrolase activator NlpD
VERDFLRESGQDLSQRLAELEYDTRLQSERNDRIFTRLEEAASVSLSPLEKMLNRAGIDTDDLLEDVRKSYSGSGGPLTPFVKSSKGSDPTAFPDRVTGLLSELDRVNLMKIALAKVPLLNPVKGSYRPTSKFGFRKDPKGGGRRMHKGYDMAGARGQPIVAPADGVVTFAGRQNGYGLVINIRHAQGFETVYAHLGKLRVKAGQTVARGDRIADMGNTGRSTGVHLHYEIRLGGKPVNPLTYMKANNDVF